MSDFEYNEEERRRRRALRIQEMKKEKERSIRFWKCVKIAVPALLILMVGIFVIVKAAGTGHEPGLAEGGQIQETSPIQQSDMAEGIQVQDLTGQTQENNPNPDTADSIPTQGSDVQNIESPAINPEDTMLQTVSPSVLSASTTDATLYLGEEIVSTHALFIDLEREEVLAMKDAYSTISPASMTKVLTVLVAAEHITPAQLDDTFTMTLEITDYGFINDCSNAGFLDGEEITVRDLFYGTILPSGADAAVGLAVYVAGSHEEFVGMMNEKLAELGLSDTAHFTNCVGVFDEDHYCTLDDMAVIMKAALENPICREVLTAHTYTTSFTQQHPEGIEISNWFLRRIEDKDTGGEVLCAKTGFTDRSGSCAVSYGTDSGGNSYICVTANATSSWKCIYDHVALYKMYAIEE